jgi:hypothetical protein
MLEALTQRLWAEVLTVALELLLGVVLCFFGLRVFRLVAAVFGFVVGFLTPFMLLEPAHFTSPWLLLGLCLVAGVACGWLMVGFASVAVAVLVGLNVAWLAGICLFNWWAELWPLVPVAAGVLGGLLALMFRKLLVVGSTAVLGAALLVSAGMTLLLSWPGLLAAIRLRHLPPAPWQGGLAAWLVLVVAGIYVQYRWTAPKVMSPDGD